MITEGPPGHRLHPPPAAINLSSRFAGIVDCRPRWGLTWRGWLLLLPVFTVSVVLVLYGMLPFLAPTYRIPTDTLVVEGWIDPACITAAALEYRTGHYKRIFTTGGPFHGASEDGGDEETSAFLAAEQLKGKGVPAGVIQIVPSRIRVRERTYSSALALRQWLGAHGLELDSVMVVTEGPHSRRSRLLFEDALGPKVRVGVISLSNPEYDRARWWQYSEGVKEVISEAAAYVYARLFFYPSPPEAAPPVGQNSRGGAAAKSHSL